MTVPYDPVLPVTLTTDASPTCIAAVLSHIINKEDHPIAFTSRSLSNAEQNYSQLDREALAIVFGVNYFHDYLYGRQFTLVTDNQALTRIFHSKTKLPKMTSARLLRYASFLSSFNYNVTFKKGIENQNVDCLSRASIKQEGVSSNIAINDEVNNVCSSVVCNISSKNLTPSIIKTETGKDEELLKIINEIQRTSIESEYMLNDGILFKSHRIVIPKSLQNEVLKELHATHIGITKMKQLERRHCTWKSIDKDIADMVKSCIECSSVKHSPAKAPIHHWDPPENNWDRIHIDYAGPFQQHYFLVVIDSKSRWAEIEVIKETPNSNNTINLLNKIFSTHGYPFIIVSDNASIFTSGVFNDYCQINGIKQKFIAPGHPATNGLAERNVQTLKNRLKAMINENLPMYQKIQKILLRYRATPLANGKSPSEMYLNRQIRIKLDAMKPYHEDRSKQRLKPRTRIIQVGERVQAKFEINNKHLWKPGTVVKKLGKLHYIIQLDEGRTLKRHINQLVRTNVQRGKVTFKEELNLYYPEQHQSDEYLNYQDLEQEQPMVRDETRINYPDDQEQIIITPEELPHQNGDRQNNQQYRPEDPNQNIVLRRSTRERKIPKYLQDYDISSN